MELLKDPRARAEEGEATRDMRALELKDWVGKGNKVGGAG